MRGRKVPKLCAVVRIDSVEAAAIISIPSGAVKVTHVNHAVGDGGGCEADLEGGGHDSSGRVVPELGAV